LLVIIVYYLCDQYHHYFSDVVTQSQHPMFGYRYQSVVFLFFYYLAKKEEEEEEDEVFSKINHLYFYMLFLSIIITVLISRHFQSIVFPSFFSSSFLLKL
jgi:hypothetical protein